MDQAYLKGTVLVSACLLGLKTRYDGRSAEDADVIEIAGATQVIPVCPEQLGGLPTPRPRAEICSTGENAGEDHADGADVLKGAARVVNEHGTDVTERFLEGARAVVQITGMTGAKVALLKEKSPSCGVRLICKRGETVEGSGVTTAMLRANGIIVRGF